MFEHHLAVFDKILVTGPVRSGTRVCARMIAYDTGMRYVDEWEIGIGVKAGGLKSLCDTRHKFVVHCPAWFHHVRQFDAPDTAIVVVCRDPQDISASRARSGHDDEAHSAPVIASLYEAWRERIMPFVQNPFEVQYEDLAAHPMWVSKERRRQMHWWRMDQVMPSGPTLLLVGSDLEPLAIKLRKNGAHLFVSDRSNVAQVTYKRMVHYVYGVPSNLAHGVRSMGGKIIVRMQDWKRAPEYAHLVITGDVEEALLQLARGKHPSEIAGLAWRDASGGLHGPTG